MRIRIKTCIKELQPMRRIRETIHYPSKNVKVAVDKSPCAAPVRQIKCQCFVIPLHHRLLKAIFKFASPVSLKRAAKIISKSMLNAKLIL